MSVIPEIHESLVRAVVHRRGSRLWSWSRRRVGLLAFAALVVAASAVAAGTGWYPLSGDSAHNSRSARRSIPGEQVTALAVLRRPQTAADRGPAVVAALRGWPRSEVNGLHTDGVRLLRRRADGVTILVPTERVGRHDPGHVSSLRRHVLCVRTAISEEGSMSPLGVRSVVGMSCGDLGQLRRHGITGVTNSPAGYLLGGLVPDGVARVVIRMRHHRTLTAAVRDNFYEVNVGSQLPPARPVRWLNADGRTISHG